MRTLRVPVIALAVVLLAGGCTSAGQSEATASRTSDERATSDNDAGSDANGTTNAEPDPGDGSLDWGACADDTAALAGLQCSTLEVPIDPKKPSGAMTQIALARTPSTGDESERIGSLVLNPGGPGGSGIEFLSSVAMRFPTSLTDRFDLVSFDPRGVGDSSPVRCLDDAAKEKELEGDLSPDSQAEIDQAVADQQDFVAACQKNAAEMLTHMSTADVAADLDRIRIAVGDDELTYLGYSYGTEIGAVYATLFPENSRALVLDGAVSPDSTPEQESTVQAQGFEHTLANFIAACDADSTCAIGPDAASVIASTRASLEQQPIQVTTATGTRTMGVDLFDIGLASSLYDTSLWTATAKAIRNLKTTGGAVLLSLVDRQTGRQPDGTFDNSSDVQSMVSCADVDERPTVEEGIQAAGRIAAAAPTFGQALGWGALSCLGWPLAANPLPTLTGEGAPPILVVGTVGDPATPYQWAQDMTSALESATLLTYEGDGHTAFLRGGPCIEDAVVAYLVDLEVPADGTSCPAQQDSGLREETISGLLTSGFSRSLAECVVDGVIADVGSDEFDRMLLEQDMTKLSRLFQAQTLSCATAGN